MCWIDEDKVRIISNEGLDVIFKVHPEDFSETLVRTCKALCSCSRKSRKKLLAVGHKLCILSFAKIDNFESKPNSRYHEILERQPLA